MSITGIEILSTDKKFYDSPDAGPDCICSRCGKPILGIAIRCWPDDIDKNPKENYEYRFHAKCVNVQISDDDECMDGYDNDIEII
jgi:hypothetical protein